MEGLAHLLSLKVMRVSRPTLASAWEPFYSSSPSFSAHSTASILSLQGKTPLEGHPKTLRDLTHATEMLTLPSSFGSIQLGETFSSCLSVNNEASVDIHGVSLKVEMQTATSKVTLAEFDGENRQLDVGATLENVVHHEIKELGQHVLGCTVTYHLPPNSRSSTGPATFLADQNVQTFRKFYKFVVTNPLSVKTKVHIPRSPSALFSSTERNKVFLEVHIQNLAQESLWFERMRFECVEGWKVEDANVVESRANGEKESIFAHSIALMQPQDTRQYIFVLQPVSAPPFPITYEPGSSVSFGRLDISWRSAFGEPGRLLTSMLSRRIPVPQPPIQAPASALPSYLKRSATPSNAPYRPRSPQATQSRTGTPPPIQRPDSPFKNRVQTGATTPQSQDSLVSQPTPSKPLPRPDASSDIRIDLLIRQIERETIAVEKPFSIKCDLIVSTPILLRNSNTSKKRRILTLAVQHVQAPRVLVSPVFASFREAQTLPTRSIPSSSMHTRVPSNPVTNRHSLPPTPSTQVDSPDEQLSAAYTEIALFPAPFVDGVDETKFTGSTGVMFLGTSTIDLQPIELLCSEGSKSGDEVEINDPTGHEGESVLTVRDFELLYMPLRKGFSTIGGLRVLLMEDKLINENGTTSDETGMNYPKRAPARVLEEWSVIGEIWVKS